MTSTQGRAPVESQRIATGCMSSPCPKLCKTMMILATKNSIAQKHFDRNGVPSNRVFPPRQKELFDDMSAQSPCVITVGAMQEALLLMSTQAQCRYRSWMRLFKPCAFGLIGLAIAVALWGFDYKLSLYHCHTASSSRVPVAKLWIEPRNASVAADSSLNAKSHFVPASHAFPVPVQRLSPLSRTLAHIPPLCRRDVAYFDFLIPFRSPPTQRFSLA